MKNLDLTKLLKNHIGEAFYSPVYGKVILTNIVQGADYPITISTINDRNKYITSTTLTKEGKYYHNNDCDCLLFPSKDNKDWSTFNPRWRAKKGEKYYFILHPTFKPAYVEKEIDNYGELIGLDTIHIDRLQNNNYFKTKEEAQVIADKINSLF